MTDLNAHCDKIIKCMNEFIQCSKIRLLKLSEQKVMLLTLDKEMNLFKKDVKSHHRKKTKVHLKQRVSNELYLFLGISNQYKVSKAGVAQYISNYVKDKNLRDNDNKRYFYTNKELSKLFHVKLKTRMTTIEIMKYIHPHFIDEQLST